MNPYTKIMQFPVIMAGNFKLFMEEKGYDSTHTVPIWDLYFITFNVLSGSFSKASELYKNLLYLTILAKNIFLSELETS